jgi:adenine-specific DNA-methyltransferase
VQVPDFVLTYMSGRSPQLVKNDAGVTCTNTVHSIRLKDRSLAQRLLPSWDTPFVQLSCELEGHPLGGGMLKLEVREAARVCFPNPEARFDTPAAKAIREGLAEMRRWRHYGE